MGLFPVQNLHVLFLKGFWIASRTLFYGSLNIGIINHTFQPLMKYEFNWIHVPRFWMHCFNDFSRLQDDMKLDLMWSSHVPHRRRAFPRPHCGSLGCIQGVEMIQPGPPPGPINEDIHVRPGSCLAWNFERIIFPTWTKGEIIQGFQDSEIFNRNVLKK